MPEAANKLAHLHFYKFADLLAGVFVLFFFLHAYNLHQVDRNSVL